jgi:hypothetical protein
MIEDHGYQEVLIADLTLPDDIHDKAKADRIAHRAASIARVGLLHPPIVRKRGMTLISGEDRTAAHLHLGREYITVRVLEGSDEDFESIRRHENIHRRYDLKERDELLLEDLAIEQAVAEASGSKRPKVDARKEVAKRLEKTHDAVKMAERRAQKRLVRDKVSSGFTPAGTPSQVKSHGVAMTDSYHMDLNRIVDGFKGAAGALRRALRILEAVKADGAPIDPDDYKAARAYVNTAIKGMVALQPVEVCKACKTINWVREQCQYCEGRGYLRKGEEQAKVADTDVIVDGEHVELDNG